MSCEEQNQFATTRQLEVWQGAGERQEYAFDLTDDLARQWSAGRPHGATIAVRPRARPVTGLEYVSSGGISAGKEPLWPLAAGGTAADGTLTWTAQAMSFDSYRARIDDADWTTPSDFTASDQVETDSEGLQEVRITVSGGVAGQSYDVVGLVTDTLGLIHECRLKVHVV